MGSNLSTRVIENCKGCGRCCEVFEIGYPRYPADEFEACTRSEIDRFKALVGLGEQLRVREEGDTIILIFPFPCKHLAPDKTCTIYDSPDRPLLCRKFPSQRATKADCPGLKES